jgi:hypothetical protein
MHGAGLRIYFSFMKLFLFCFTVCGGLACFNAYLNFRGYFLNELNQKSVIDRVTLANIYGFENMTTNSSAATWIDD